ncbi:hypothetical protein WJX81_000397 [Elliptochloris bilobata]|uniref:YLP motif-containing protein 1 n=1 Tax=Elliptochloris bilobata TaxID=381761 RepID=A0AAW1SIF5_9CHLO
MGRLEPKVAVTVVDARELFCAPGRATRPKRVAVVLRGLPGSGKTRISGRLRDAEVAVGGEPPRIHSIDDYFVTEVEREVEEADAGGRKRKRRVHAVEYCHEPELEGKYQASLLKAFQRTVEEARFAVVVVDAPNLRVEDVKPYWAAGQRAGYEVYTLQPVESDPEVCFRRNVHGRQLAEWEAALPAFPLLDVSGLLKGAGIQEVEMQDDGAAEEASGGVPAKDEPPRPTSRWTALEDAMEEAEPEPVKKKKAKALAAGSAVGAQAKSSRRRKSVTWADEMPQVEGFHFSGQRQLETVYWLSDLGPPKGEHAHLKSFAQQVKEDHKPQREIAGPRWPWSEV